VEEGRALGLCVCMFRLSLVFLVATPHIGWIIGLVVGNVFNCGGR